MRVNQLSNSLVNYVPHYMDQYNIGDVLSNPLLYFDIKANSPVNIVGGGVWQYWYDKPNTIYWAPGKSTKNIIDQYKKPKESLITCSRDIDSGLRHVPCVSVMNKIVDTPIGTESIFVMGNDDTVGFKIPDNMMSVMYTPIKYIDVFSKSNRISTNSYHAAYWGLLSGRKVRLYGYSSKFVSLLKGFGFTGNEHVRYDKGSPKSFNQAIRTNTEWLTIDHNYYKIMFREMNLDYASDVAKLKEIDSVTKIGSH